MKVNQIIKSRIFKNFYLLFSSNILSRFVAFFARMITVRLFEVEVFGEINFYISIINYILLTINLGFDIYFTQKCNEGFSISHAIKIQYTLRGLLLLFYSFILILIYIFSPFKNIVFYALFIRILPTLFDIEWAYRVRNQYKSIFVIALIHSLISLVFVPVIYLWPQKTILLMSLIVPEISRLLLLYYFQSTRLKFVSIKENIYIIKNSIWINLSTIFVTIYYNIDTIFLGIFKNTYDVGIYSAAYNIMLMAIVPTGILFNSYSNRLSQNKFSKHVFKEFLLVTSLLGVLSFLILFFLAPFIIPILYGEKYLESVPILQYLSLNVLACYVAGGIVNPLNLWGFYKEFCILVLISAVFNICANYYLIPVFGISAAIFTTIASEVIVILLGICLHFFLKIKNTNFN